MAEPEDEEHIERKVVYENVSTTSNRNTAVTVVVIAVIAIALVVYILMHMR